MAGGYTVGEFFSVTVQPGTSDAPNGSWLKKNVTGKSWNNEAAGGSRLSEYQYVIGLTLLLMMILLGVVVSVLMCLTIRRNPMLWSGVFGGLMLKTNINGNNGAKFPRRVRFNVPDNHDVESTGSAMTVMISVAGESEDAIDQTT
ncbi:hypothetical protein Hamer_G008805 [Homarus americanus]|uniref:Uncharacterized protein n=1 Tax=Homarus americanus TaxID=6706 RepID=A0A8J5JIE8_HOMAM|nr:hypothetical protein Hamer_G008805 [Homarus americanus]